MSFEHFEFDGEDMILPLLRKDGYRCGLLVAALEAFIKHGESRASLAAGNEGAVAVYLTPARFVLRGVASAAALVRIDYGARVFEIIDVIGDYVDGQDWDAVVVRATVAIG